MIVSVVNQKGGTGKTTSTINLAKALELHGKRILLIDMDPQGSLTYSLGVVDIDKSIADVLYGDADLLEVIVEREGMDVIPASISLADVELSLVDVEDREYRLKYLLEKGHSKSALPIISLLSEKYFSRYTFKLSRLFCIWGIKLS